MSTVAGLAGLAARWALVVEQGFAGERPLEEPELRGAIEGAVASLDAGELRVASPPLDSAGAWTTHAWLQKAILLYFRTHVSERVDAGGLEFFDKVPPKRDLERFGVRVVPPGVARYGSFLERGVILMPGFVNIGARVGEGTMIDTWATVGSCAQIGARVHLSGGVGIGGVLEPPQAAPVVIEDDCFIGSRCIVVEGVRVRRGAVLGAGVVLTASSPIVDVTREDANETRGEVPENAVVIPGYRPKKFAAGNFGVPCALVIGRRRESTDRKTSLNDALREFGVIV